MESQKRPYSGTDYASTKRVRSATVGTLKISDTLDSLRNVFPVEKFQGLFPPIIMRHYFYSILPDKSKTEIDREIDLLRQRRLVKCFRLDLRGDEVALIKMDDFREHIRNRTLDRWKMPHLVEKFLDFTEDYDISLTVTDLKEKGNFSDSDIKTLVNMGLLVLKDIGSYWFSFPGAGQFVKASKSGRDKILRMVKKARYSTVLENDLLERPLPKNCLGTFFAVHDIVGAELVDVSCSTSGRLLRHR